MHFKDSLVFVYDDTFRLVRSEKPKNDAQCWYIITNDFISTRKDIIATHYHRFEIEEFFRDAKHIFRMEYISLKRSMSFQIVLWFVIMGTWLSWYPHEQIGKSKRVLPQRKDGKWPISIVYYWFEEVQRAVGLRYSS